MKKSILSIFVLLVAFNLSAQKQVTLTIKHLLGANQFGFNVASQNDLTHNFKITRVDYYISSIKIIHDGGMIMPVPNHYILAKGDNNVVDLLGTFNVTNVEGIKFSIGVQSPVNTADPSTWLAPHPLSPQSPSMHWGWSAGYRFIAIEGMSGATFNTNFQMHGLGNANYFEQTIMVAGVNNVNDVTINLDADYNQALKGININAGPIDHGVNATDLTVIQNFRDFVFKAGTGIPLSVDDIYKDVKVNMYPNPSTGTIHVQFDKQQIEITSATICDVFGKVIKEINLTSTNNFDVSNHAKGLYVVKFYKGNANVANRKLIIE
ncbi:MAG: T9SS type A sorting domain-containing protein [Bacteroidetes bacterium]|nr:T9SS type A sorting domain-containing protein [Bacteroidota bacterium]